MTAITRSTTETSERDPVSLKSYDSPCCCMNIIISGHWPLINTAAVSPLAKVRTAAAIAVT